MKLIDLATRRRVTILMFTVAVLLFGFVSLSRLPVNLLPDLSYPTMTVRTEYPGAAPAEMESLVTKPVEEAVGIIKGVRMVRSVSRAGQSDVTLEFMWGTNMDYAALDVREKLEVIQLPLEADRPTLLRFDPSTEPVLRFALSHDTTETTLTEEDALKLLRRHADEQLKQAFEAIAGVAAVKVSGGLEDEIQVNVDQYRLAQLGLRIEEVAQRLRAENVNLSGGRLEEGTQQFLVRTINEFTSVGQIADSIIATRDGRPVYLRDIADVREGWAEREAITRADGLESVELAVYREGDANVVQVAGAVNGSLERIRRGLPENMQLVLTYDQSVFIDNAIKEVISAALIGGVLAILILYLFLRSFTTTLIIGISIPVSVIATFAMMYGGGVTLNIMSLGGIALAIGMLVDNSIVVLENIATKREQGVGQLEAARSGTREVGTAVVASTLTTIAVFLPLVFVDGIAGQLFRDQSLTVTFALLISLVVALTLIPMLASLGAPVGGRRPVYDTAPSAVGYQPRTRAGAAVQNARRTVLTGGSVGVVRGVRGTASGISRLFRWLMSPVVAGFNWGYDRIASVYPRVLGWALAHRLATLGAALLLFAISVALLPRLGVELIPQMTQGEFNIEVQLAPGTPLERTDEVIGALQAAALEVPTIARTYAVSGTGNRLDANPEEAGENTGTMNVVMQAGTDEADEAHAMRTLRAFLDSQAGVQHKFSRPELFSFETPLEIEVAGYELAELKNVSGRIASKMMESDRFTDVRTSMELGHPEVQIHFDHERAARLGLRVDQIADTVVKQVRGEVATRYTWHDRKIDVLVRASEDQRQSVELIRQLVVNPESDHPITLAAVADVSVAIGPSEIRRIAQERVAIISANLAYGDLGAATNDARAIIANVPHPAGIITRVAGQSEEMERSFDSLMLALTLAVFLVYLVMASQFESLLHPFVILFTVPLALIGAVFGLWITGSTVSVVVFIGLIMLAGIVVNNAIVLVTRINQLREDGLERVVAIMEAGRARLRPIIMTTLTTVLGLTPLALGLGEGAEMRAPMAITVIGGLIASTMLTLVVIPVMYSLVDIRKTKADVAAAVPADAHA